MTYTPNSLTKNSQTELLEHFYLTMPPHTILTDNLNTNKIKDIKSHFQIKIKLYYFSIFIH